jgi:hypothetical protein
VWVDDVSVMGEVSSGMSLIIPIRGSSVLSSSRSPWSWILSVVLSVLVMADFV